MNVVNIFLRPTKWVITYATRSFWRNYSIQCKLTDYWRACLYMHTPRSKMNLF